MIGESEEEVSNVSVRNDTNRGLVFIEDNQSSKNKSGVKWKDLEAALKIFFLIPYTNSYKQELVSQSV